MMTRVQVLLPGDQDRRLEALAARRRESKGKVIRRALDLLLRTEEADEDPLLSLIGQAGRAGRADASARHDFVLTAAERARNRDHDFSFVDATSFALMRAERIRHAFAFDSHFATAGFMRVPVDVSAGHLGAPRSGPARRQRRQR